MQGPFADNVVRIPVRLAERISSQDARSGDTFDFDTTSSVEIQGEFLPAQSHGHGVVVRARSAKGPVPGILVLEARTLDLPDGKPLAVGLAEGSLDRSISRDVRSYPGNPGSVEHVPFDIGGSKGTNIVYEKGTAFTVVAPPPPTPGPEDSSE